LTVASFEEMEPIYDGLARRARACPGVTGWGLVCPAAALSVGGVPPRERQACAAARVGQRVGMDPARASA